MISTYDTPGRSVLVIGGSVSLTVFPAVFI
jgi:hypothetical protein